MKKSYINDPDVKWVVEHDGITLIHHRKNESCFLGYPEAAIWDFITQNFSYQRMIRLLSFILSTSEDESRLLIDNSITTWAKNQFIINQSEHGKYSTYK